MFLYLHNILDSSSAWIKEQTRSAGLELQSQYSSSPVRATITPVMDIQQLHHPNVQPNHAFRGRYGVKRQLRQIPNSHTTPHFLSTKRI